MTTLHATDHSRIRRVAKRASYDLDKVVALVNDVKTGHIGFISNERPTIIPITVWAVGVHLYLHVANKSRLQRLLEAGGEICVSVAECSEWVMAKSAYHHSANYRSAVLYCTGERVTDEAEFDDVFKAIINDLEAGRWDKVRAPNAIERKATALMKLTINEGAFKQRTGGPNEEPEDMELPVWHGNISACPMHRD
jgi:nitroimidazol reductase NimA-like FMN-containing flavoprotein (pyridoxamine 5'-phosphate oxidase superfamily)